MAWVLRTEVYQLELFWRCSVLPNRRTTDGILVSVFGQVVADSYLWEVKFNNIHGLKLLNHFIGLTYFAHYKQRP